MKSFKEFPKDKGVIVLVLFSALVCFLFGCLGEWKGVIQYGGLALLGVMVLMSGSREDKSGNFNLSIQSLSKEKGDSDKGQETEECPYIIYLD